MNTFFINLPDSLYDTVTLHLVQHRNCKES